MSVCTLKDRGAACHEANDIAHGFRWPMAMRPHRLARNVARKKHRHRTVQTTPSCKEDKLKGPVHKIVACGIPAYVRSYVLLVLCPTASVWYVASEVKKKEEDYCEIANCPSHLMAEPAEKQCLAVEEVGNRRRWRKTSGRRWRLHNPSIALVRGILNLSKSILFVMLNTCVHKLTL